jgi:hypothetical protein
MVFPSHGNHFSREIGKNTQIGRGFVSMKILERSLKEIRKEVVMITLPY